MAAAGIDETAGHQSRSGPLLGDRSDESVVLISEIPSHHRMICDTTPDVETICDEVRNPEGVGDETGP
jgi:hypothetical protein